MNKATGVSRYLDEYMGCYGNFRTGDQICRNRCALRLRCAIERDQQDRMEILEDIVSMEGSAVTVH
jgi:hypothetical protein